MGHKGIAMTVRYALLSPGHTLAAVERLAGPVSETPTDPKTGTGAPGAIRQETAYLQ